MPEAVRTWANGVGGGGRPRSVRDLAGGFSPGATAILEWPERAVFVKAVGPELNPDSPAMHRREAVISAALPTSPRFPRLLATYDDGRWVALAFEAVDGRPPHHPWDPGELAAVAAALAALHEELTPSPRARARTPRRLRPAALRRLGRARHPSAPRRASTPGPPRTWIGWPSLESGWPEACAGATLVHGDVRADNVLLAGGEVVFVDWPHGSVGNPAFDVVGWAPSVVLEGGPPPEELLAGHGPSCRVDPDVVTVLLAAVSGFFVAHSLEPAPPGLPTLRRFQAAQGEVALDWLRRRTGW